MRKIKRISMALLMTGVIMMATACGCTSEDPVEDGTTIDRNDNNNNNNNNNATTEDKGLVDDIGDDIRDDMENVGEDIKDGVDDIGDDIKDGVDDIRDDKNNLDKETTN